MKPLNKTDWSLYSTILLIIICIQGSLQHSDRRELHDDYRFDPEDRRVGLKDRRISEEPALNVPQHIQDVRADSRRSRIDAQDIRTDFREIRTELGERREARLSGRFNLASRSDSRERMSNVRRERQTRINERQSERTDSRNHRGRFEPRLDRARRTSTLARSQDRFNSRRDSRETNLLSTRRFNAERSETRFNRRASQERAIGQDLRRGRFDNERLDRRTLDSQRFSIRENSQRRYNNERSETSDNRRELRQNSRDAVRENNQRRQNSERFDRMRSTSFERVNRLLTQTRRQLNRESSRIFRDQTTQNRRSRENLNEARLRSREDTTHKLANGVDRARVTITHRETSSEDGRRVKVRSQSSRATEMRLRVIDDDVKERTENQLALNSSQKGLQLRNFLIQIFIIFITASPIGPSTLNSNVIVSTIQVVLVLLLGLQMVGNKAKQPFRY